MNDKYSWAYNLQRLEDVFSLCVHFQFRHLILRFFDFRCIFYTFLNKQKFLWIIACCNAFSYSLFLFVDAHVHFANISTVSYRLSVVCSFVLKEENNVVIYIYIVNYALIGCHVTILYHSKRVRVFFFDYAHCIHKIKNFIIVKAKWNSWGAHRTSFQTQTNEQFCEKINKYIFWEKKNKMFIYI